MGQKQKPHDEYYTLRINGDTLRELRELANRNDRSVAGEVRRAITLHLERETEAAK